MRITVRNFSSLWALIVAAIILFIASFFFILNKKGYWFNFTVSFPFGFYKEIKTDTLTRGDLVIFCPPKKEIFKYAMDQGFLLDGTCMNGSIPLIKKIAGIPGDTIEIRDAVYINSVKQNNSEIQKFPYRSNNQTLKNDDYFLMSDYCKMSFDSRYFGPINKHQFISKVEAVYTWY